MFLFFHLDFGLANLGPSLFRAPSWAFFLWTGITVVRFSLTHSFQPELENTILFFQPLGVAQPIKSGGFDGWQHDRIADIRKDGFSVLNLFYFLFEPVVLVISILLVDQTIG